MTVRTLRLRQEPLADLTTDELHSIDGGSGALCDSARTVYCNTVITYSKVLTGCMCSGRYPSLNDPCPEVGTAG